MRLIERIRNDLKDAMKAGDRVRVDTLRSAVSALTYDAADSGAGGHDDVYSEGDLFAVWRAVVMRPKPYSVLLAFSFWNIAIDGVLLEEAESFAIRYLIGQCTEAIDAYAKGRRADLEAKETAQRAMLTAYLPTSSPDRFSRLAEALVSAFAGRANAKKMIDVLVGVIAERYADLSERDEFGKAVHTARRRSGA